MAPISRAIPPLVKAPTDAFSPKRKAKELTPVSYSQDTDQSPRLSPAEQEMAQKAIQAAKDHNVDPSTLPRLKAQRIVSPIHPIVHVSSRQGIRPSNEDAHVHKDLPFGTLLAICDGHGDFDPIRSQNGIKQIGQEVAELVAESIENDLPALIHEKNFNTVEAFKEWCSAMQAKMPHIRAGTTAAIAFVEKVNLRLHVATIGDTEVVVFRKIGNHLKAIPLSEITNWSTSEYVEKVRTKLSPEEFAKWEKLPDKHRRWPPVGGVNIANTLGDKMMVYNGQEALTHRPECSLFQLEEGDLILIGCDGVFDFVKFRELPFLINHHWDDVDFNVAKFLTRYALEFKGSTDNVSAITLKLAPRSAKDPGEPSLGFPSPSSPVQFLLPDPDSSPATTQPLLILPDDSSSSDDPDSSPPTPKSDGTNNELHQWVELQDYDSSDDEVDPTPPMEGVVKDAFE